MKSTSRFIPHAGWALLPALLLAFGAGASASDNSAAPPTSAPEAPLREIGVAPSADARPSADGADSGSESGDRGPNGRQDDRVSIMGSVEVRTDERISGDAVAVLGSVRVDGSVKGDAVAVLGSNTVNGHVRGDTVAVLGSLRLGSDETVGGSAVAVLGSNTVGGTVGKDAVAVMGSTTINGTVHGDAVAVFGNLTLGPGARVDGDVVSQFGRVICDPTASYGGSKVEQTAVDGNRLDRWLREGPAKGRLFTASWHSPSYWIFCVVTAAVYLLLALAFPNAVAKCADTLATRPGATFLTGILAVLALPILCVLLCITFIGIPVALVVLPVAVIGSVFFGKTAVYALTGRRIIGRQHSVVAATLLGLALFLILYQVPVLGFIAWFTVAFLGYACAVTTVFSAKRRPAPSAPGAPAAPAAAALAVAAPPTAAATPSGSEAPAACAPPLLTLPLQPAPIAETGLPRAGFWIRMAALAIDMVLVGIVTRMHDWFLPALATYAAVLWQYRGATIGGIIFGIKVVRLDGRPSDWVTMAVRALACFISLVVVGLGFFWIAFDPDKQAWHDKIAGTVVVRLPKGVPLV